MDFFMSMASVKSGVDLFVMLFLFFKFQNETNNLKTRIQMD